ncbi:hypothetical protein, partial [Teredinibacter turnerae]|uniref:hypothetical protein n=1 Tax=Teredinibacter turnerae TaxID=2426 RepID=UPI000477A7F4
RKAGKQESRKAGKQESRKAGKQESRKAGKQERIYKKAAALTAAFFMGGNIYLTGFPIGQHKGKPGLVVNIVNVILALACWWVFRGRSFN